ncbi:leukemia inhibitory factor [Anolis sagrei]|uniref:leukemia inhibitory factor n=1 Tax=Anolis sagrei TaxID=38937 RepID=UPI00352031BD
MASILRGKKNKKDSSFFFSMAGAAFLTRFFLLFSSLPLHGTNEVNEVMVEVKGVEPVCAGTRPSSFQQVQCQVQQLHLSAQELLFYYVRAPNTSCIVYCIIIISYCYDILLLVQLERQGFPFWPRAGAHRFLCAADPSFLAFPSFSSSSKGKAPRKALLCWLLKAFSFFEVTLQRIGRDQEDFSPAGGEEATGNTTNDTLLLQLRWTRTVVQGLLANLHCLPCSRFRTRHRFEHTSGTDAFDKKRKGCQALQTYAVFVGHAARALGKCTPRRPVLKKHDRDPTSLFM